MSKIQKYSSSELYDFSLSIVEFSMPSFRKMLVRIVQLLNKDDICRLDGKYLAGVVECIYIRSRGAISTEHSSSDLRVIRTNAHPVDSYFIPLTMLT